MTDPNSNNPKPAELDKKIDELEDLLQQRQQQADRIRFEEGIPVLDDLVDFDEEDANEELFDTLPELDTDFIEETVHHAMNNIDEKLTDELEGLVNILKNSIKDSVLSEIREQLEHSQQALSAKEDKPKSDPD